MFTYSICKPLESEIIKMSEITSEEVMRLFEEFPWIEYLNVMNNVPEENIFYSPSLEIENKETRHGLSISIVGDAQHYEYYIFYKRSEMRKSFFGLLEHKHENYISEKQGQTYQDAKS
ncbi:MAG: hypothetical protein COW65_18645, partial [Cytophagales bacterium CG18_big_fil_WC_8_21_14_2_50_42_9]